MTKFSCDMISESSQHLAPNELAYPATNVWADLGSTNQLNMRRFYLPAVDQVFARMDSSGTVAWYLNDHLGSVDMVINSADTTTDRNTYDAFGNLVTETTPTFGDRYKWTGREFDTVTGLQYNRARYYSPSVGSWITQDPSGLTGGVNLYCYATDAPTWLTDPTGLYAVGFATDSDGNKSVEINTAIRYNFVDAPAPQRHSEAWDMQRYFDMWTPDRKKAFAKASVEKIEKIWNGSGLHMWVLNGKTDAWEKWTPELHVRVIDDAAAADFRIGVLANAGSRNGASKSDRVGLGRATKNKLNAFWDEDDVNPTEKKKPYKQTTVAHEYGHLIAALEDQYDTPASDKDPELLMAFGDKVIKEYFSPWETALYEYMPIKKIQYTDPNK